MDIADFMIHIHPELSSEKRASIEETVSACEVVISVHFSPKHAHEILVAYNPEAISSKKILDQVRQWDKEAVIV